MMPGSAQSIQQGSSDLRRVRLNYFQVTDARFPPSLTLPSHFHERACFAVVIAGAVEKAFSRSTCISAADTVVTMPPQERHSDLFSNEGAHMLVVEPDSDALTSEWLHPCRPVLAQVNHFQNGRLTALARRLLPEIQHPDPVSPLAISGLVLEMLALASRLNDGRQSPQRAPDWLKQARDYLHAHFDQSFEIADVAAAVGVHPVYLARVFRRHYGASPSSYLRRLRLDWVRTQLVNSPEPLSELARQAGFADQSHLTRLFKRHTGLTPHQYRLAKQ